jgi:hypothetical protein
MAVSTWRGSLRVTTFQPRANGVSLERNGVSAWRDRVTACVTALQTWRNGVSVTCNDVSVKHTDTRPRREHVSLIVGFGCLDLGLGSSIRRSASLWQRLFGQLQRGGRRACLGVPLVDAPATYCPALVTHITKCDFQVVAYSPTVVRPFFCMARGRERRARTLILPYLQALPKSQQPPLRSCERLAVGFVPDGRGMTEQRLAELEEN